VDLCRSPLTRWQIEASQKTHQHALSHSRYKAEFERGHERREFVDACNIACTLGIDACTASYY
jgi:hypothetical protein